ncbi:MAG TPA: hypothetical protein VF605_17175 [Allosphingosinicella sp.]|jgi:hypothetical protein
MFQMNKASFRIKLTSLESFLCELELPDCVVGIINPISVSSSLAPFEADFYIFEADDRPTVLNIFPVLMLRTREDQLPLVGDVKEVTLLGLYGADKKISLSTYVRATATIVAVGVR